MTDPNFIRWLYRYANGERQHLAVFVRQASRAPNEAVRSSLERSAAARWKLAGVKPIWSNYYGEVAQFVHEIGLHNQSPGGTGFPERAAACLATAKAGLMPASQAGFLEAQEELSSWLEDRVKDVRSIADGLGGLASSRSFRASRWSKTRPSTRPAGDSSGASRSSFATPSAVWSAPSP
jgi:hypothetical protein